SATTGSLAMKAWKSLEEKSGRSDLQKLVADRAGEDISFNDITAQHRKLLSTPVFSGTEIVNLRYSPFTMMIELLFLSRTVTGRQHFYLDHNLMQEFGESLPTFKPPLQKLTFYSNDRIPEPEENQITLRYLTPHFKWSYHSTYGDT